MYSPIVIRLLQRLSAAGGEITDFDVADHVDMDAVYEARKLGLVSLSGGAWTHDETVMLKRRGYEAIGKTPPPNLGEELRALFRSISNKLKTKVRNG